jgi:hypothetical protein
MAALKSEDFPSPDASELASSDEAAADDACDDEEEPDEHAVTDAIMPRAKIIATIFFINILLYYAKK